MKLAIIHTLWKEVQLYFRLLFAALKSGHAITPVGRLYATHISTAGNRTALGLVSTKVVTTAGVNYIATAFTAGATIANFKYHGSGTGVAAEAIGDTALGTEVGTRGTGTQVIGGAANIYRTVCTLSYTSTLAITEHGILSASSAGTLLDRSVFAAINVINGDSVEFTYDLTLPAGS